MPAIEFEVVCSKRGHGLCNTVKVESSRWTTTITLPPCEKCIEHAYDDGHSDGYDEGHAEGYEAGLEGGLTGYPMGQRIKNVWLGVTAENQQRADERIPMLLQIPAVKRFVSIEPMLGPARFKTEKEMYEEAAGMGLENMFFSFNNINPNRELRPKEDSAK